MLQPSCEILPVSGNKPRKLVIFLHGVGADGENLISLSQEFQDILPDAHFISPNAPFVYDMAPIGYQWFSLMHRDETSLLKGLQRVAPILEEFIEAQLKRFNLDYQDLILIGFSQGTMTALYTALRYLKGQCAALIGYSGILIGTQDLEQQIKHKPNILLIHGDMDDIVPYAALRAASKVLNSVSVPIETYTCTNVGHSITMEGIEKAREFLKKL